jgi:hypothetical protein
VDWIALLLVIVGAVNWGLMGILERDLIIGIIGLSWDVSRIIYIAVGAAGLWSLVFVLPKSR